MPASAPADAIRRRQEEFYQGAEIERFDWLTGLPIIQKMERALLSHVTELGEAVAMLEVGCGEGANLATLRALGARARYTGFDCFPAKIAFCRSRHPRDTFVVADARTMFPFRDGAYDRVLIRDVLHHLSAGDRVHALRECGRVLSPGGTMCIVEGNAANLIGAGFALLFPHERCMLETRISRLTDLVAGTLPGYQIRVTMEEPSNLTRLVAHYRFGLPRLGRVPLAAAVLAAEASVARSIRPQRAWAYSVIRARKPIPKSTGASA
jgi:ubiquinone/menaquinone biosynthesis C-methylase UbiE